MEEEDAVLSDYFKLDNNLEVYKLSDMFLWITKVDKAGKNVILNLNKLTAEYERARLLYKEKPGDKNIVEFIDRLRDKLKDAQKKETKAIIDNPLSSAIELMTLTAEDVVKWTECFNKMQLFVRRFLAPKHIGIRAIQDATNALPVLCPRVEVVGLENIHFVSKATDLG